MSLLFALAGPVSAVEFERISFPMPERCDGVVVTDVDADGDQDLVGICRTEIVAVILPEEELRTLWKTTDGAMIHGVTWDADGDGDRDIAVCRFTAGEDFAIGWLEIPGLTMHPLTRRVDGVHGLAAVDLDGDGREDLVSANVNGPLLPLSVTLFDGVTKAMRSIRSREAGPRPHYPAIGDVDGDSRRDVVLGDGGGFALFTNPGPGAIASEWPMQQVARREGGTNVSLADLDGDGDLDLAGSCGHGKGVVWFGNPEWTAAVVDEEFSDVHALDAGDLDGDGDIDIVAGAFGGYQKPNDDRKEVRWYENDGDGNFRTHSLDSGNAQESYSLVVADADSDGHMDIVLAGRASNNLVWYQNLAP